MIRILLRVVFGEFFIGSGESGTNLGEEVGVFEIMTKLFLGPDQPAFTLTVGLTGEDADFHPS